MRHVSPAELPQVWSLVEPGLIQIQKECEEPWHPVDVYRLVRAGHVGLFLHDKGFVVLERCAERLSLEPYMNVWVMWFQPGEAAKHFRELMAWLDARCLEMGCAEWRWESPRDGWDWMKRHGFKKLRTIYGRKP